MAKEKPPSLPLSFSFSQSDDGFFHRFLAWHIYLCSTEDLKQERKLLQNWTLNPIPVLKFEEAILQVKHGMYYFKIDG